MSDLTIVKSNRLAFLMVCAVAFTILIVSELSYRRAVKTLNELGTMGEARMSIQRLERGLLDAEMSQRGYLLTSRQAFPRAT